MPKPLAWPLVAPFSGRHFPLPVSAGASERVPDPIYAAIERHRRAYQDWMDNLGEDEIEDAVPYERRQSSIISAVHGDPDWQVAGDDPRWIAHIQTAIRVGNEHEDAAIELVSCDPTSFAGAVALLEYVATWRLEITSFGLIIWLMTTARAALHSS